MRLMTVHCALLANAGELQARLTQDDLAKKPRLAQASSEALCAAG